MYSKGLADRCHFLLVLSSFFGLSFAIPNLCDKLVESDHLNMLFKFAKLINGDEPSGLAQEYPRDHHDEYV
ncbi:MAG: hypothetical protein KDD45_07940 [Bdellovibrionales bacterium]|nr:hypothetical protein [Bdellovibrionales bacterium]